MKNLIKILPVGARSFQADGQRTDMKKLVVDFYNFAKAPKSGHEIIFQSAACKDKEVEEIMRTL
jgi:hypothetical protein